MVAGVTLLLRWVLLPVSLVVGLAALSRMAGPVTARDDLTGVIRLPRPLTGTILALFALDLASRGHLAGQHVGGEGSPERVRSFNISIERRSVTE